MAKMTQQTDDNLNILLWGPGLSGKTVLATQFPMPYVLALDPHALMSVRGLRNRYGLDFDVDTLYLDDDETTDPDFIALCGKPFAKLTAWEKLKKCVRILVSDTQKRLPQDATLIIDNVSRMSESLLFYIRKLTRRNALQIQDWMIFIDELQELLDYMKSNKRQCNVIIIAHDELVRNAESNAIERLILLPTKIRHRMPTLASDYLYMTAASKGAGTNKRVVRKLRSMPDPFMALGSRCLIPDIENPTYARLRPYLETALGRKMPEPNWTPPDDN